MPPRLDASVAAMGAWVKDNDANDYAEFLERTFPTIALQTAVEVVNAYRAWNMWTTPRIGAASFARWQTGIAAAHLTDAPIAYDALIEGGPTQVFRSEAAA